MFCWLIKELEYNIHDCIKALKRLNFIHVKDYNWSTAAWYILSILHEAQVGQNCSPRLFLVRICAEIRELPKILVK